MQQTGADAYGSCHTGANGEDEREPGKPDRADKSGKPGAFWAPYGKMSELDGQLSFFNEAEYYSEDAGEPELEEVLPQKERSKKQKGKREADLKDFSEEMHDHDVAEKQLNEVFGEGNWREMPAEEYKRLRYEPASWTVGQLKTIKCMYMWVRMAAIRMNSFVGTVPRIFCATVSLRRL